MVFDFFKKISTPIGVGLVALVTAFAFFAINSHRVPGILNNPVVNEHGLPDMATRYAPAHTYELFDAYGEQGRYDYAVFLKRVDSIFPMVYGFFFVMATTFGFTRIFPARPGLQKLALLPLAATFFDYAENFCFLAMLRDYPARLESLAKIANLCTLTKWGFALLSIVLLLIAAAGLLVTKILQPKINQTV